MRHPEWERPQEILSILSNLGDWPARVWGLSLIVETGLNSLIVTLSSCPNAYPSPNPQLRIRFLLVRTNVCKAPQAIFEITSSFWRRICETDSVSCDLISDPFNFSLIKFICSITFSIDSVRSFSPGEIAVEFSSPIFVFLFDYSKYLLAFAFEFPNGKSELTN